MAGVQRSLTAFAVLAASLFLGGWEWCLLSVLMLIVLRFSDAGFSSILAATGAGILLLALFQWTDNRELFFPFAMQYAVHAACLLQGRLQWPDLVGGGGMIAAFLVIRVIQHATFRVLVVELAVAVAVVAVALAVNGRGRKTPGRRAVAGAVGALLAFAGLFV